MRFWARGRGAPGRRQCGSAPRGRDKGARRVEEPSAACLALDLWQAVVRNLSDSRGINVAWPIDAKHQHELAVGVVPGRQPVLRTGISRQIDAIGAVAAADCLFAVEAPPLRRIVDQRSVLVVKGN